MMLAHIVPISELGQRRWDDVHMMLPHLLKDNVDYQEFFSDRTVSGLKILDNGVAEAVYIPWDDLLGLATRFNADEIVAPDEMGHCDQTIEWCKQFAPIAKANKQFKYIGVVQGKSYAELMKCLMFYESQSWISILALPRVLATNIHKEIRVRFVEAFSETITDRFEAVHCLGGHAWVKEVIMLAGTELVRSMDSSVAAVMGLEKRLVDRDDYLGRQSNFFDSKPNTKQRMCMQHNIGKLNEWAC